MIYVVFLSTWQLLSRFFSSFYFPHRFCLLMKQLQDFNGNEEAFHMHKNSVEKKKKNLFSFFMLQRLLNCCLLTRTNTSWLHHHYSTASQEESNLKKQTLNGLQGTWKMDPFSSDNKLLFDQTLDTKIKLKLTKRTQSTIQLDQKNSFILD